MINYEHVLESGLYCTTKAAQYGSYLLVLQTTKPIETAQILPLSDLVHWGFSDGDIIKAFEEINASFQIMKDGSLYPGLSQVVVFSSKDLRIMGTYSRDKESFNDIMGTRS
jgi:hypothetical protein